MLTSGYDLYSSFGGILAGAKARGAQEELRRSRTEAQSSFLVKLGFRV